MTKVLLLLLVPKGGGGFPRDPTVENHFPSGILRWNLHHICKHSKNHNSATKFFKSCTAWKWWPNNRFLFCVILILAENLKNHFPKGIFQWNLAQSRRTWIDLPYWNNISKKTILFQNGCQSKFLVLCNNGNSPKPTKRSLYCPYTKPKPSLCQRLNSYEHSRKPCQAHTSLFWAFLDWLKRIFWNILCRSYK